MILFAQQLPCCTFCYAVISISDPDSITFSRDVHDILAGVQDPHRSESKAGSIAPIVQTILFLSFAIRHLSLAFKSILVLILDL